MNRLAGILCLVLIAGCAGKRSPELLQRYQGRQLYTCCNIRFEKNEVSDANYHVGTLLGLGTPVAVVGAGDASITIDTGATRLTLVQSYGKEPLEQYADKWLVGTDPKPLVATFPRDVQAAIREGRVERGMTREQVLLSLGHPPTHRTPSLDGQEWTYWYNRWMTFRVVFDDQGVVANFIGNHVPTSNQPIVIEKPKPAPKRSAPPPKKKR